MDSQWRPVSGYEDTYEVSSSGDVRSVDRTVRYFDGRERFYRGRTLRQSNGSHGYPMVNLCRGGSCRAALVHRLVLESFVGPCPDGMECRHIDGNRLNPRLANLAWGTSAENSADTRRHGWDQRGQRGSNASLTLEQVLDDVLPSLQAGETQQSIASRLGITQGTISRIACGKSWSNAANQEVCRG